jgi:hypothetical protein
MLARENSKKFSYQTIQKKTWELLEKHVPKFSVETKLVLPTLKKIN